MANPLKVWDGTQWVQVTNSVADLSNYYTGAQSDAKYVNKTVGGLNLVIPTGATNGSVGTNGAVTVGTAVSSVTVNGAFSATYDNYKIVMNGVTASATHTTTLQLGSTTTLYYDCLVYNSLGTTSLTALSNNGTYLWRYAGGGSTNGTYLCVELLDPFASRTTRANASYMDLLGGGSIGNWNGFQNSSTSFTSFTVTPSSGTWTGGTIRIYGYNNGA